MISVYHHDDVLEPERARISASHSESAVAQLVTVACLLLAVDLMLCIDTESSPHIPSSSGPLSSLQSSTNTDVLGALKYARTKSLAMMCLIFSLLDFPFAALLTMNLNIFYGRR